MNLAPTPRHVLTAPRRVSAHLCGCQAADTAHCLQRPASIRHPRPSNATSRLRHTGSVKRRVPCAMTAQRALTCSGIQPAIGFASRTVKHLSRSILTRDKSFFFSRSASSSELFQRTSTGTATLLHSSHYFAVLSCEDKRMMSAV